MSHAEELELELEMEEQDTVLFDEENVPAEPFAEQAEVAEETVAPAVGADSEEMALLRTRNDQLMRIAADFENYKRRHEREKEDWAKYAGQQVIATLLPVIDNFERALQTEPKAEEFENFVEGVRMIHRQLVEVLGKAGVEVIQAVGEPFNPEFHEAIMSEASDEVPDETVLAEFQKGYVMNGRLLRPSIVKVSKEA
ncbi:MAG: nucleotide exchange factor GrpE [Candidatus Sericytochromatia bacterium]|nr:nucleotide exchange factor GrpE [Candidatus Sericytochromatia bacterium]